ncbi:MAG: lytic murein transglycosylase [Rhodocyclaceae bacterium]|nr:lytic murein transglycosylase [Rhodocyclaceae bacterium]
MRRGALAMLLAAGVGSAAADRQDEFRECLGRLEQRASAAGISQATLQQTLSALDADFSVLERLDYQPEFRTPIWDYLGALVDEQRVEDGRAQLLAHADTLAEIERRYGVDPATVVAVWGVESDYGKNFGGRPLLSSLGTLSCFGRRQDYFRGEFIAVLGIIDEGSVAADKLRGSWAGAFGHTQFMPSTYLRLAVDFDGDGRRDLVDSVPDALASTANFLDKAGWRQGEPWGFEVRLPAAVDLAGEGRKIKRSLAEWSRRGVVRADHGELAPPDAAAGLVRPADGGGPAFLLMRNFDAIYAYNASMSYGLAIAHLADRLRGGGGFVTPWPTDDLPLDRAGRRELQRLLLARGHDIGPVDGAIGSRTRAAIVVEQRRLGWDETSRAGQKLLRALREVSP